MSNFNSDHIDLSLCSGEEITAYATAYKEQKAAIDMLLDWPGDIGIGARTAKACAELQGATS